MLQLANVDSFYGNSRTLQDVSLHVGNGQFAAVLGRNGVGKTTLLRTILGLTDRSTGSIRFDEAELVGVPTHKRATMGIAYVPQGRGILPTFSVRDNLLLGTFARRDSKREIPGKVFDLFPILRDFLDRAGGNLSGGQQQQLAIGRALAANPRVMLLDEPTEGIQPNVIEEIERAVVYLNREEKITIILVEQDFHFARKSSDIFFMMEKGAVAVSGPIVQLTDDVVQKYMTV